MSPMPPPDPTIRYRIRLYQGRVGAPLDKLGRIAEAVEKFLRAAEVDADITPATGNWIAKNFKEGSLSFDAIYFTKADLSFQRSERHRAIVRAVSDADSPGMSRLGVSTDTLQKYADIASPIEAEDQIMIGVYTNGVEDTEPREWHVLTGQMSEEILRRIQAPIKSFGAVQGVIHALYKESDPKPYFQLRDICSRKLVKCFYSNRDYDEVVEALNRRDNIVNVEGMLILGRAKQEVISVDVERMEAGKPLTAEELERFFGIAPDLTGRLTTTQFLDAFWADDE